MTTKYIKEKDHHGNVLRGEILPTGAEQLEGASPGVPSNQPIGGILSVETSRDAAGRTGAQGGNGDQIRRKPDGERRVGGPGVEPRHPVSDPGIGQRLAPPEPLIPGAMATSEPKDIILDADSDIGHNAGAVVRFEANLEAIRTLKRVEAEDRPATPDEQSVLARYSGFGDSAFNDAFRRYNSRDDAPWKRRGEILKAITTEPEYEAIERSRLNAYYTSPQVIKATWDALERLGVNDIDHPKVLEPSAGSGRFLGFQPIELAARSKRTAVELDDLTGRMLKQTYPETAVYVMGYQQAPLPNDSFDVAISNVPFGNYAVSDPAFTKGRRPLTRQIHNYFFAKTLDKLKPGGVLAFVTSHYTLDAPTAKPIREMLAEKADLLGAIRLPEDAFPDTKVVTDLIFMRKRLPGEPPGDNSWVDTRVMEIRNRRGYADNKQINAYFAEHPEMVMGLQTLGQGMYRDDTYTVTSDPDKPLQSGLTAGIKRLPPSVIKDIPLTQPRAVPTPSGINAYEGSRVIGEDGAIWIKRDGHLVPANLPTVDQDKVKAMLAIRDAARKVIEIQVNAEPDTDLVNAQETLNREYDTFVTSKGPLNANKNRALLKGDPDGPFLLALERDDREHPSKALRGLSKVSQEKANEIKMPLFSGRTIHGMKERTVNDDTDAAIVSMNETGRLDFNRMAELLGQTDAQVRSSLAEKHRIFKNPIGGWETADEYLTGDVRDKLQIAQAAASAKPVYRKNVEALKAIQPPDLPPSQISVGLGAPWIPASDVNDFIDELLDANSYRHNYFNYVPATGEWVVENLPFAPRSKSFSEWGTERMGAPEIIKRLLNGKAIEVKDRTSDDKSVRNDKETVAAQEKANAIQNEFKSWVWMDDERAERLAKQYNTIFNSYRPRTFDGSHMDLPGMREAWARKIHPHIKDAIWRVSQDRTALLAHEVGFGKTAVMVGAGMELKRLGLARKNMYVVPKAIHSQFKREFQDIYPYANILFPEESDFSPANRQEFVSRVATGDWDAVILSDSQFRRIPVRPETAVKFLHDEIGMIRDALEEEEASAPGYGRKSRTHKDLQKALVRAEAKLETAQAKVGAVTDKTMCFEDLGVDQIFVDEADMYKNLAFSTRMGRIKGLPNTNSDRAWDMYQKTRYLQDNGGNGVVFATGTPIANTIAEMYTMMRYLQNDMLDAKGLQHFDSWAKTFGETTESLEQTPTGDYRLTSRFAKFKNMSELSALWQNVADIRVAEEVPNIMKLRPRVVDDEGKQKRTVIKIPPDEVLLNYMATLAKRADELSGKDPRDDNMLKIANDARMASLDMRMVDPGAPAHPEGKIAAVSKNVARIYRDSMEDKGTQLVFLDIGTPKAKEAPKKETEESGEDETTEEARVLRNVYGVLKDNLLAAGIPAADIAFIHDCKTNEQRRRLYEKVNKGEVRVLIGSTGKMGAGVNIQERAAALHHMDAPWRPRDIEQREGRIIRQGNRVYGPKFNENGTVIDPGPGVKIYTYVTERSFDAYMWQAIESKSKAIKSIMRRDNPPREIEDVDSFTMSAGEAKAVATGNPDVMKMVQLKNDVARLQMLEASHTDARVRAKAQLRALPHEISGLKESIGKMDTDAGLVKTTQDNSFTFTVQGKNYAERPEAGKALVQTLAALPVANRATPIGKYRGFTFSAMNQGESVGYKIMASNPEVGLNYTLKDIPYSDLTESGVLSRIDNKISAIPDELEQRRKELDRAETNLKNYHTQAEGTFAHKDRMGAMQSEMTRLEKKLQGEKVEEPAQAYIGLTEEPLEGEEAPAYRYGEVEEELAMATIDKVPPGLPSLPDPADTEKELNVVYGAKNDSRSDEAIAQDMESNEPTATKDKWNPSHNDLPGWDTTDIKDHQETYEQVFAKVKVSLDKAFEDDQVEGRVKTLPSIVKKLKKKNTGDAPPFTQNNMEDIAGLRVTFDDLEDLKAGVESVKSKYKVVEDEDYITTPKSGYRSYHLTIEQDGRPLELQFRTPNMTKWGDWTHNTLYDHTDVTKQKVGEAGFKQLQDYAQAMSDYYAAKDAGKEPDLPDVPKIADKIGGGMEPRPIRLPKPQKAAYPATATVGARQIGLNDPEPTVRVMGHEASKVETKRIDNIDYELYRTDDGLGMMRVYDNDGQEIVTMKKWPHYQDAKTEFDKTLHNLTAGADTQPAPTIPDAKGKGVIEDTWRAGNTVKASGTDPNHKYEFRLKVVDLDEIQASHTTSLAPNPDYPAELQPRVRDRAASKVQVEKIARELNPEALLRDVGSLDRGPVIVGPDMMVESGNGRAIALKLAAQEYPEKYAAYRDQLIAEAESHGITGNSIKNMIQPVLVRERITDVDRVKFAGESNQMAIMAMSPYEQAIQDSKQIKDNTIADLTVGENQSIDQALLSAGNRPLVREFSKTLTTNERAAIQDQAGKLNQTGLQRLKAALFSKTFPGEAGQRLTKAFFESLDPTVKNVENGLFASLPAMAKAEGLTRAGERHADLSLSEDLSKAVDMLARLKQDGLDPEKYIQQGTMWERELTPTQEDLMLHINSIGRSPKKIRELTTGYAERVESSPHPDQSTMFASGERVSNEELLAVVTGKELRASTPKLEIPKPPAGTDTGLQPDMFSGELKQVTVEGKGKELQADLFAHGELEKRRQEAAEKPKDDWTVQKVIKAINTGNIPPPIVVDEYLKSPSEFLPGDSIVDLFMPTGEAVYEVIDPKSVGGAKVVRIGRNDPEKGKTTSLDSVNRPRYALVDDWHQAMGQGAATNAAEATTPPPGQTAQDIQSITQETIQTATADQLRDLIMAGGGHPNQAGYNVDRYEVQDELESRGDQAIKELGWPTEPDAKYKNIHTRHVSTFAKLQADISAGEVWAIVENWEPVTVGDKALTEPATRPEPEGKGKERQADLFAHGELEKRRQEVEPKETAQGSEKTKTFAGDKRQIPVTGVYSSPSEAYSATYHPPKKGRIYSDDDLPQSIEGWKQINAIGKTEFGDDGEVTAHRIKQLDELEEQGHEFRLLKIVTEKKVRGKPQEEVTYYLQSRKKVEAKPKPEKPSSETSKTSKVKITVKAPAAGTGEAKMTLMPPAQAKSEIARVQEGRTKRALASDNSRQAHIGRVEQWLKHPNHFDLPGVDLPGGNGKPQLNKGLLEIRKRGGTVIKKGKARGKLAGRGSSALTRSGGMKKIGQGRKKSR
jgi:N12 class adenine-specific DNA methylase/ppGpp synthetase/RelA/SpoT-type nucleotidyltranferase